MKKMLEYGKTKEHITQIDEMWNLWSALVLILNEESFLNYNRQEATLCSFFRMCIYTKVLNLKRLEFLYLQNN
jgi:hypothetical protein